MSKFKYLNDKDPWLLAEHFPDVDFFFAQIWLSAFANDLENSCGRNYKKVLAIYQSKFYIHFYYGEKDSHQMELHLINKMRKNTRFGSLINQNIIKHSDNLRRFAAKVGKLNLKKMSNYQLAKLLVEQDKVHTHLYEWGWLSNATDMFHGSFTTFLQKYLDKQILNSGEERELNEVLNVLTMPDKKSVQALAEEELLKIANLVKKNGGKINKKIDILIEKHHKKYFYLKHLWLGKHGVYSKDYYKNQALKLTKDRVTPPEKLKSACQEFAKIKRQKKKLFKELKINKTYQDLFEIYADFMLTKIYRRYVQLYWAYQMKKLLNEVGRRLALTLDEVRYMLPQELKQGLLENTINRKEIRKRLKFFLYYVEKGIEFYTSDKKTALIKQSKQKVKKDVKELTGQVGWLGKAKGKVKIINSQKDMAKMKKGDILVSIATNPDIVLAMKKAAAIVTEQGGVTSHAAIVSRELGIPSVIGTKIATKVLKDGDRVEVDATKGVVKKL